jgi:hypothetical protein
MPKNLKKMSTCTEEDEYMHNLVTEISVQNSSYNSIIKTNSLSKEKTNHAWQ